MSDSNDTIPYNIEEIGEPREREQSPSPIPPPCPTPPLEASKTGGGGTERLGEPQRGGAVQDVEEGLQGMEEGATKWLKVQYQVVMPMYKNAILHVVSF